MWRTICTLRGFGRSYSTQLFTRFPKSDLSATDIVTYPANTLYAQKIFPTTVRGATNSVRILRLNLRQSAFISSFTAWVTTPLPRPSTPGGYPLITFVRKLHNNSLRFFTTNPNWLEISKVFTSAKRIWWILKPRNSLWTSSSKPMFCKEKEGLWSGVLLRKSKGVTPAGWGILMPVRLFNPTVLFPQNGEQWRVFPDQLRQTRPEYRVELPNGETPEFIHQRLVSNRSPHNTPGGNYAFDGGEYVLLSNRNAYRIPDYYRVDASLNYDYKKKSNQRIGFASDISVYNILGETILFGLFVAEDGEIKGWQSSI